MKARWLVEAAKIAHEKYLTNLAAQADTPIDIPIYMRFGVHCSGYCCTDWYCKASLPVLGYPGFLQRLFSFLKQGPQTVKLEDLSGKIESSDVTAASAASASGAQVSSSIAIFYDQFSPIFP